MALDPPVFFVVIVIIIRFAAFQRGFVEAVSAVFFYGSAEALEDDAALIVAPAEEGIMDGSVLHEIPQDPCFIVGIFAHLLPASVGDGDGSCIVDPCGIVRDRI